MLCSDVSLYALKLKANDLARLLGKDKSGGNHQDAENEAAESIKEKRQKVSRLQQHQALF